MKINSCFKITETKMRLTIWQVHCMPNYWPYSKLASWEIFTWLKTTSLNIQMKIKIPTRHAIQKHVYLVQWGYAVFWTHSSNIYFNWKPTWSQYSSICIDSTPTTLLGSKWRLINSFGSTLQYAIALHRTSTNYHVNDLYQNKIMHKEW